MRAIRGKGTQASTHGRYRWKVSELTAEPNSLDHLGPLPSHRVLRTRCSPGMTIWVAHDPNGFSLKSPTSRIGMVIAGRVPR